MEDVKIEFFKKYQQYVKIVNNEKYLFFAYKEDFIKLNKGFNKLFNKRKDLKELMDILLKNNKIFKLRLSSLSYEDYSVISNSIANGDIMLLL